MNTTQTIMNNCYMTRKGINIWQDHQYTAGIDCSGFVQRCQRPSAVDGNMRFPYLGERSTWTNYRCGAARACTHIVNGVGGVTYAELIGDYGKDAKTITFHRVAPGDIIIRAGVPNSPDHVAIINYITGERGNKDLTDPNSRDGSKIRLIQAIGGSDKTYQNKIELGGRTTDTWRWSTMTSPATYKARRILP